MNLLVDSSVWVFALGPRRVAAFVEYLSRSALQHQIVSTGMVRLELMAGAVNWPNVLELQLHFSALPEVEPRAETWTEAGRMSMRLKEKGFHLRAADLLTAAVALENDLTLAHADLDFDVLARHEGLRTESLLHLIPP